MQHTGQSWFPQKVDPIDFSDYLYNADFPRGTYGMYDLEYVPSNQKPSTEEIVNNIMIVAPTDNQE